MVANPPAADWDGVYVMPPQVTLAQLVEASEPPHSAR